MCAHTQEPSCAGSQLFEVPMAIWSDLLALCQAFMVAQERHLNLSILTLKKP